MIDEAKDILDDDACAALGCVSASFYFTLVSSQDVWTQ
jgi:hypothetical protein